MDQVNDENFPSHNGGFQSHMDEKTPISQFSHIDMDTPIMIREYGGFDTWGYP